MTISYDAYVMQQLVAACQTANDEIIKAQQLITSVKSHADWTCKEKSVIDELMEECKKLINRMQDDETSFLNILKEVEGELEGAEQSISNLFQGVESILAKVLSIPAGVVSTVGTGLLGAAGGALGNVIGGMGGAAQSIADQMMDQFDPDHIGTGGWISSGIGKLQELMEDIGSDIQDDGLIWHGPGTIGGIGDVIGNVQDALENVTNVVSDTTNTIVDSIQDTAQTVWDNVNDVINPSPVIWPNWDPIVMPDGSEIYIMSEPIAVCDCGILDF